MKARNGTMTARRIRIAPLVIGVLSAFVIGAIGLLLSALLMTCVDVPQGAVTALSVVSAALGAFFGGILAAKIAKSDGWLNGLLCGAVVFLAVLLIGWFVHHSMSVVFLFVKLAILLCGGMVGGMIGVSKT